MVITDFRQGGHGNILFTVDKSVCQRIVDHLNARGILAAGAIQESGSAEIDVDIPIETLNLALKDFNEQAGTGA